MGFFSNFLFSKQLTLSEELDQIGYFNLIQDNEKKQFIKEKIDYEYQNDDNPYIGKGWLILPNDYYISSVHNLKEYDNGSSSSDFRAFDVWGSNLFRGEFVDYLRSAKVVFEKNGLWLEWKNEIFDENSKEKIHHRITVNNKEYIVFSGEIIRDNMAKVIIHYINIFKDILNDAIYRQNSQKRIILLTQPEYIIFVLLDSDKLNKFKKIISKTKNKLEE